MIAADGDRWDSPILPVQMSHAKAVIVVHASIDYKIPALVVELERRQLFHSTATIEQYLHSARQTIRRGDIPYVTSWVIRHLAANGFSSLPDQAIELTIDDLVAGRPLRPNN